MTTTAMAVAKSGVISDRRHLDAIERTVNKVHMYQCIVYCMYDCMYVCMSVCARVCMRTYIHMYIHNNYIHMHLCTIIYCNMYNCILFLLGEETSTTGGIGLQNVV